MGKKLIFSMNEQKTPNLVKLNIIVIIFLETFFLMKHFCFHHDIIKYTFRLATYAYECKEYPELDKNLHSILPSQIFVVPEKS